MNGTVWMEWKYRKHTYHAFWHQPMHLDRLHGGRGLHCVHEGGQDICMGGLILAVTGRRLSFANEGLRIIYTVGPASVTCYHQLALQS